MSTDLPFTPVSLLGRRKGWAPPRQIAFVAALRDCGSVTGACRAGGLGWRSAYRLRARAAAHSFATAWGKALAHRRHPRPSSNRAIGGIATPITYRGRAVGERRRYDNRLATLILCARRPAQYGAHKQRPAARVGPAIAFDKALAALAANLAMSTVPPQTCERAGDVARSSSPSDPHAKHENGLRPHELDLPDPSVGELEHDLRQALRPAPRPGYRPGRALRRPTRPHTGRSRGSTARGSRRRCRTAACGR